MKVDLYAEIKQVNTRMLISNDVSTRIVIEKSHLDPASLALVNAMFSSEKNRAQELKITIEE